MNENKSTGGASMEKRVQIQVMRERKRLRGLHGERLASIISEGINKSVLLHDFKDREHAIKLEWPSDIRSAPGLVLAYVSENEVRSLLSCIEDKLGVIDGEVGFHDKFYMGFAEVSEVSLCSLVSVAKIAEDSVVFHLNDPRGVVMIDCYSSQPGNPFSFIAQGDGLIEAISSCFKVGRGLE